MNLSKEEKLLFYDYICEFEKEIYSCFGEYNFDESNFQNFRRKRNIYIDTGSSKDKKKKKRAENSKQYILFNNTNFHRGQENDMAHNLLRHIRNSMAHGNITRKDRKTYSLKDYGKDNCETMSGRILISDFKRLLELLKATRTTNVQ